MLNTPRLPRIGEMNPIAEAQRATPAPPDLRESAKLTYREGIYELSVAMEDPSGPIIKAWSQGEAEFALVVEEPVIVLCYRFAEAIPWSFGLLDSWRPSRQERARKADDPIETRALLSAVLTDAAGKVVHAVRNVTLSLEFTRALREATLDGSRSSGQTGGRDRALVSLRRRYLSADALAAKASVRCLGCP